jgi:hypothetical protein
MIIGKDLFYVSDVAYALKVIAVCGTQFVYYSPGLWH